MTDATHLLKQTALNTMKDEDIEAPIIRCALDEKQSSAGIEVSVAPFSAPFVDPPFLSEGSQQVCSDPPIWVFDDLVSESLCQCVDSAFDGITWQPMNGRQVRMVELSIDEQLAELTQALREISHIEDVAPCGKAWIMDVQGRNQGPHVDGWEIEKNRESMQLLDLSKCSVQCHNGFSTIIPTLSFVIYFNDSGGCAFPQAALANPIIPAKRGRIVMFQNYDDLYRPAHNPKAVHYGVYGDAPKRVMTAGVMSSETPAGLLGTCSPGTPRTRGFLYAPIMHRSNTACGSNTPPTPPPKPKAKPAPRPVFQLLARSADSGGFIVEATNLGGSIVAKTLVLTSPENGTLGYLRACLKKESGQDAQLVSKDEVLEGLDSMPLKDTVLFRGIDVTVKDKVDKEKVDKALEADVLKDFPIGSTVEWSRRKGDWSIDSGPDVRGKVIGIEGLLVKVEFPEGVKVLKPSALAPLGFKAPKVQPVSEPETLVEWDVIDTVFVKKDAADANTLGLKEALHKATEEEVRETFSVLSEADRQKISKALQ